jgi:hypothetical protein
VPAVKTLHKFLAEFQGQVKICDPYFDAVTIEHLDACSAGIDLRILTKNINDGGLVFEEHLKDRLTCETVLQSDRSRAVNRGMTSIGSPLSCREEK